MLLSKEVLFSKIKSGICCFIKDIKEYFLLPMFLRGCPKCNGQIKYYFYRSSAGNEQWYCPKCKIIFTEKNPTKYKDTPSVAYQCMKKRVLEC